MTAAAAVLMAQEERESEADSFIPEPDSELEEVEDACEVLSDQRNRPL